MEVDANGVYIIPKKVKDLLKTPNDWAFYILNNARKNGISRKDFYKIFVYTRVGLPALYGAPKEMQSEIEAIILNALKALAQM